MRKSLTYYITLWVIQIKGVKKTFRHEPIEYKKLRKEDIRQPKSKFFTKYLKTQFNILDTTVSEIKYKEEPGTLLLFIHGGAFVSGPGKHHWKTIEKLAKETNCTIWMCDYPKAPENKIGVIANNIDAVYAAAAAKWKPGNIIILGDSVGGTLITSLIQRVIQSNRSLPSEIILVSPVMDASFSNPLIDGIDKKDPMLSKKGALSAKIMCAGKDNLKDLLISPIYGTFNQFPKTTLFLAENDITFPDQQLLVEKLQQANVDLEVVIGKEMPHIWPFLPVMKEAKTALNKIISIINKE